MRSPIHTRKYPENGSNRVLSGGSLWSGSMSQNPWKSQETQGNPGKLAFQDLGKIGGTPPPPPIRQTLASPFFSQTYPHRGGETISILEVCDYVAASALVANTSVAVRVIGFLLVARVPLPPRRRADSVSATPFSASPCDGERAADSSGPPPSPSASDAPFATGRGRRNKSDKGCHAVNLYDILV